MPAHPLRIACVAGVLTLTALGLTGAAAQAADTIYWSTPYAGGAKRIYFANLDGTSPAPVTLQTGAATQGTPWGLAPDPAAGKIYWGNYLTPKISWANLDGSGGGDLVTTGATVSGPSGVVVDHRAGKIYWANTNGQKISWANLDGSGGGDFNTGTATVSNPVGISIDTAAKKIYWANYVGNKISFAKLDNTGGGDLNIIGTTVNQPWGVTISQTLGKVFWGNFQTNNLDFAGLDGIGGGILTTTGIAQQGPMPGAIDYDTGKIYWSNWSPNGAVVYSNLNGNGGGGTLYPSPGNAQSAMPVLLKSPKGMGAPSVTASGTITPSTLTCSQGTWGEDLIGEFVYRAPRTFAYQWTAGGVPIGGATQKNLSVTSPGEFRCMVTATNHAGSTTQTSDPVTVSAPPPPPPVVIPAPPPPPKPSPYPRFTVTTSGNWSVTTKGVRLAQMRLRDVPAGATVKLTCKPCKVNQTLVGKGKEIVLSKLSNRLIKRGQTIAILVTRAGSIGDYVTLKVKHYGTSRKDLIKAAAKPFTIKHACVPVGAKKSAKSCPSSP